MSLGKLKPLYLHYHGVSGHQTCYNGDIPWQGPNHKAIQGLDHVVLQRHVTNKNHYISIARVAIAKNLAEW